MLIVRDDDPPELKTLVAKYRKQVLGDSRFRDAPSEYHEIALCNDLGIRYFEWKERDMHERAMIMAQRYLSNMVSTVDAHYRAQDENSKKNADEAKAREEARRKGA